jgi:hypothetical protein
MKQNCVKLRIYITAMMYILHSSVLKNFTYHTVLMTIIEIRVLIEKGPKYQQTSTAWTIYVRN